MGRAPGAQGDERPLGTVDPSVLAAQVAAAFASDPDAVGSTQRLLELVVEAFADWGSVHLVQPDGTFTRVAAHHRDPALAPVVQRLLDAAPLDPERAHAMATPLRERRAAVTHPTPDDLAGLAPTPEVMGLWGQLGLRSSVMLPLVAGDRPVGVMGLMSGEPDAFDPAEVTALESLAAECALLAETARLAREAEAEQGERVRLRAVLDTLLAHAPMPTAVVDVDDRVLHHNDALRAMDPDGPPPPPRDVEAVTGPPRLRDLVPEVAEAVDPLVAEVLARRTSAGPLELRTGAPGRRRYWQVSAFPIVPADGRLVGAGLVFVEITDEKLVSRRQRESLARLDLSLEAGGLGTWDWDVVTGHVEWSSGMEAIAGLAPGTARHTGRTVLDSVPEEDRERVGAGLAQAARSGQDYHDEFRLVRPSGEVRWIETRARVVAARDGTPLRMIGVASDVTERHLMEEVKLKLLEREHHARLAAEASRERLALLAEVSGILASTLDPQAVHDQLASLLVPRVADWCVLDALDEDGGLREISIAHVDPDKVPLVQEMRQRRRRAGGDGIWSVRRAMRTGRSERVEDITDDDLVAAAVDEDHLDLLRRLAPRSALVAPLVARGRVLGGITLVSGGPRSYEQDDQALLENIASRAATAIDTANLFDSRTEVARALQQTLLPPALPEIPGVDLGARYRVADAGIEIGGDFYDVFETAAGWQIVLGDVCGKGPAAAAVTGLIRHTLRAVAPSVTGGDPNQGPAAVLAATNDAILDQIDDTRFATAALVHLRPERGRARARVACGGHPRPVLVRADGAVERVEVTGTLLGVLPDPPLHDVELTLGPGDALVLYTDGVTEARHGSQQFGETRLMEALADAADRRAAVEVADQVVRAVDEFRDPDSPADDIAVVVIRLPSLHDG